MKKKTFRGTTKQKITHWKNKFLCVVSSTKIRISHPRVYQPGEAMSSLDNRRVLTFITYLRVAIFILRNGEDFYCIPMLIYRLHNIYKGTVPIRDHIKSFTKCCYDTNNPASWFITTIYLLPNELGPLRDRHCYDSKYNI